MNNLSSFGQVLTTLTQQIGVIMNRLVSLEKTVRELLQKPTDINSNNSKIDENTINSIIEERCKYFMTFMKQEYDNELAKHSSKIELYKIEFNDLKKQIQDLKTSKLSQLSLGEEEQPVVNLTASASCLSESIVLSDIHTSPIEQQNTNVEEDIEISKKATPKPKRTPRAKK